MRWLCLCLTALAGCRTTGPDLRPPPQADQYNLPPVADSRYDKPYNPPRNPRDPGLAAPLKKAPPGEDILPARGPRAGTGPAMF
jgi:hypothetical protein